MSRAIDPRLFAAAPSSRRYLMRLSVLALVGALATIAQAGLLAHVVAGIVLGGRHGPALARPVALLACVAAARALLAAGQEWLAARASAHVRADIRVAVLTSVRRLGPVWADRQPSGRLATASGPGIEALDGWVTRAVPALVTAAVVPPLVLVRVGLADWRSAVVLLVTVPLVPVFMVLVGVTTRRRMEARYAALAQLSGHFLDLVEGLTTLKVYGQARRQVVNVRRATDAYREQTMATLRVVFLSGLVLDLLATLSVAVVAVSVGLRLDQGKVGLEASLVVLLLAPELFAPLRAMGTQHHAAEEGRAALSEALDIVSEAALPLGVGVAAGPADGSIDVRDLRVCYPGRPDPALLDLCLTIVPGTVVAVQGVSGSGKTTLLAVLLRFVDPVSGDVVVGADRLSTLNPEAWRTQVAWVPQRPRPTQHDVAAEVALGDPSASAAQVAAAIDACHAPAPGTLLGEDGAQVSAGQRRRIALARALLRARGVRAAGGVPVVLLDEPSEDLDLVTEDVVASVISGLAGWATVVMVTHSPRLAAIADRRVVLAAGRLVVDQHQLPLPVPTPAPALRSVVTLAESPVPAKVSWAPLFAGMSSLRRRLAAAALLSGASGLAGLALTATSVWLICRAAQHPNLQALAVAVVGVRTFALARALLRYAERLVGHDVALTVLAELRARVFAALEPLAPAGLADFRRGDLLRRFVSDVDGAQEGLVRAALPLVGATLTALGAVGIAVAVAPPAGGVLAIGVLVGLVVAPLVAHGLAGDAAALSRHAGHRDGRTTAFLSGFAELVAYGHDAAAVNEVTRADALVVRAGRRPAAGAAIGAAVTGLAAALTLVAVLAAGAAAAHHGLPPVLVGVLVACVLAAFDGLAALPVAFAAWARFRTGMERVALLLATPLPVPEPLLPVAAPPAPLSVRAERLSLSPSPSAPVLLDEVDFVVRHGERVAVMGPSGSGKSTLLAAVLRLLPVPAGRIALENETGSSSVADLAAEDVPPLVAGSLQGDHVFNASLRDNLLVVRPLAAEAELDAVAARAGLLDFVRSLPRGWSTPAGPDGAALSGGQRQRLLLARALLADPAVLVLDEPTAHLDPETERAVLADLLSSTSGRTLLMSTHRRPVPGSLDVVLHLADGMAVDVEPAAVPV
ncbi:thiol reductant ABC exporter subunit CydD [Acidothermaceae bacterium B102]|nr:thiol reductant ABC exporter subunit CydD [Acidothermaceae bacterium B102]